jgi:allantoinase
MDDLILRGRRVLTADGIRPATIHIRDGLIESIGAFSSVPPKTTLFDAGDAVVMPGLVDTHVHVNEPGRTDWEGFETATRAAAAGGVTTLLDMPLNSVPATTSVDALEAKIAAATGRCAIDVGFIGGVVPGNAYQLQPLYDAGVRAFKCFLVPSGVDEFPSVDESDLRQALPILASLDTVLMVHAELPDRLVTATPADPRRYASYLASRPDAAEAVAVAFVAGLAAEYGAAVHIVHLSSAQSLAVLRQARKRGVRITAETCPHYLTFAAEDIVDGATELKCAPPIREAAHRDALWDALASGEIDMVVSDHSPCPPALKHGGPQGGDFFAAWGGIASLQLGLAAVWEGARARKIGVERVAEWMSAAPARLAGLDHRKGRIAPGHDADLIVWNPDAAFVVGDRPLFHRHPLTPYRGRTLHGVVQATFVRGRPVFTDGSLAEPSAGELLLSAPRAR